MAAAAAADGVATAVQVFTALFGATSTVVTTALENPIMLIGVGATVGGIAIAWFKSLTGQRRKRRG